ncbi:MAG: RAMP superfamily CRISPR-associated protein [Anaerolineae bacterium]
MTERKLQVTVRLKSPLLLGDESGAGNYEQTADYIPGAVLRGAVATRLLDVLPADHAYVRDHPSCPEEEQPAFWRVFGAASPPRFGNAYPARPGRWAYPFPATARTCKRRPGYRTDENRKGHGVFDTLIEQTVYDLVSDPRFPYRTELMPELGTAWARLPGSYDPCCPYPDCGGGVKPAEGYYLVEDAGPGPTLHPSVSRATHVGINRARGVAEDALLFTLETLDDPGAEFRGQLVYDEAYAADLEMALPLDGQASEFVIGRGRSRGMGLVEISMGPPPGLPELPERLWELNRLLRQVLAGYQGADSRVPAGLPGHCFSLTLCAPAILTAPDGTPALWPDLSSVKLGDARPLRAWARTTVVGGWDAAAGLPRRTRQAVQAGAVYLYHVPESTLPEATLIERLSDLEWAGIGEQRERGYGQLIVCAPFHYAGYRG